MKISITTSTVLAIMAMTDVSAFSLQGSRQIFGGVTRQSRTLLQASASEEAIKYAMEMSKKHGKTSKEAVLAWEAVEEIDSSDNSAAFEGGISEEECDVTSDANSEACKDYNMKMEALSALLKAQSQPIQDMQALVNDIKAIKLKDPTVVGAVPAPKKGSAEVQKAIASAKKASEEFGATSPEAQLAWEAVEEIASADNSAAYASPLDAEECFTDLEGACEALAEINRMLDVSK